ncbi:MAG: hypothetical protein JWO38_4863 [Gemmataceae bacterium]|nr:hypothetical protein [Gemmataceae bacterium]
MLDKSQVKKAIDAAFSVAETVFAGRPIISMALHGIQAVVDARLDQVTAKVNADAPTPTGSESAPAAA